MKINPSMEEFKYLANRGNLIAVCCDFLADTETPVSTYLKLRQSFVSSSFLLESAEFGRSWGRYSFIGFDPFMVVLVYADRVEVLRGDKRQKINVTDPIDALKWLTEKIKAVGPNSTPDFKGGLVGYLNYDVVRKWERLPGLSPYDENVPEGIFMAPRSLVIFDHLAHKVRILRHTWVGKDKDPESQYGLAVEAISSTIRALRESWSGFGDDATQVSRPVANMEKSRFEQMVRKAKEYITAGDVIQVVLSQRFDARLKGDSFALYRRLRSVNPSPYMFYLNFGEAKLIGSSPEVLVRLKGQSIELRPIAGTRPRGATEDQDRLFERELLADEKERAEHVMLVDLGRNDVGKVAAPGTVKVNRFMEVERYSHVMHIVSDIRGRLAPGKDCFDVFKAAFPAGTVTGAPKVRAMEIISELEGGPRGPYAGAVGYFGFDGNMDFCIAIRTIALMGEDLSVQAGAGIVYDSDPEREYEETLRKADALLKVMNQEDWQ